MIVLHRIIPSWHTGCWRVCCYIWYSEEESGRGRSPPRPILAVPDVTASVPITVLLYKGPFLCGFNVHIKVFCFCCFNCPEISLTEFRASGRIYTAFKSLQLIKRHPLSPFVAVTNVIQENLQCVAQQGNPLVIQGFIENFISGGGL